MTAKTGTDPTMETPAELTSISPFFIVRDVPTAVAFYRDHLGFEVRVIAPPADPFFGIVEREGARVFLKAILPEVQPVPNHSRHAWARWDAFVHTADPDALAAEFTSRGTPFRERLQDTDDGLRGFEVTDSDGYVLFFGRPL